MTVKSGSLVFVLHNHLPYVIGHGMWPHGMDWLNEAAAETYIPLLDTLERLQAENVRAGLTIGITPVLAEQLADPRFKSGFDQYLKQRIDAADEDLKSFNVIGEEQMARVAEFWLAFFRKTRDLYNDHFHRDIIGGFRELQDAGQIEIITCAATHGYLPLLGRDECVRAQIQTGVNTYKKHFGRKPRGIWLPECAYRPRYKWQRPTQDDPSQPFERAGVEEYLHEAGIEYFFVDSHLLKGGKPLGTYLDRFGALKRLWEQFEAGNKNIKEIKEVSHFHPYFTSSSGNDKAVGFFTRDPQTTIQVWSGEHGYPGNSAYLDFHKKHFPGGHRYWKVTDPKSDLGDKEKYLPDVIENLVQEQSSHFVDLVGGMLRENVKKENTPCMVCSPYDGELFGHWWFEGPRWLEAVIRKTQALESVSLVPAGEYLQENPPSQVIALPEGSWGEGGFHHIWLNKWNEWTWKHIYKAEDKMVELVRSPEVEKPEIKKIVTQMARELLLLESSDWQFLISTWSARDYAEARVETHSGNFQRLARIVDSLIAGEAPTDTDSAFLEKCREVNCIFEIDLDLWKKEPLA